MASPISLEKQFTEAFNIKSIDIREVDKSQPTDAIAMTEVRASGHSLAPVNRNSVIYLDTSDHGVTARGSEITGVITNNR